MNWAEVPIWIETLHQGDLTTAAESQSKEWHYLLFNRHVVDNCRFGSGVSGDRTPALVALHRRVSLRNYHLGDLVMDSPLRALLGDRSLYIHFVAISPHLLVCVITTS